MSASNYVHLAVQEILRESNKAILCLIDGEEVWLPKSQIADFEEQEYRVGEINMTISITEWLAKEKGLGE